MSIALLGVTGFRNRGVEALAVPVVTNLLANSSSTSVRIFSWSADYDQSRLQAERVSFVPTAFKRYTTPPDKPSRRQRLKQLLTGQLKPSTSVGDQSAWLDPLLISQLHGSRLAIISGGDVYSSEYGHDSLLYYCSLVHSAKAAGLPVVLLGHTVGRFSSEADIKAWRECMDKVDLLTTRDQLTYDYLETINGLAKQTEVCADVAFGLSPSIQKPINLFAEPDKPCVAVSISKGLHRWCALSAAQHRESWLSIISHILDDWYANVVIIPHVQEGYGDDRQLATELHRATGFDPRIWVASEDYSASEYKAIIGQCELVIAERMHAAIAGLSSEVPTAMVSYSLKVEGIAALAYADLPLGPDSMVIHANSLEDSAIALKKLTAIWRDKTMVQTCLGGSIPAIKALAARNFDHLDTLINQLGLR
ncbi:MAG: polysaccharide pyruvyl transferase family protein [Cyanobium sp.]